MCYHYTTSQYPRRSVRERGRRRPPASFKWGGIWGSNPRHPEPQSGALPAELIPPYRPRKLRIDSLPRQARKLSSSASSEVFRFCRTKAFRLCFGTGTPRGIRTPDLLLRRQLLYPAELLARIHAARSTPRLPKTKPGAWACSEVGAGDGNRTHVSSLEGWCSTIELHPRGVQSTFSQEIIP